MAIFDSVKDEVTVVTPVYPAPDVSAKAAYARASERLHDVIDAFDRPLDLLAHAAPDAPPIGEPRSNTSPDDYMAMVGRAKDYIAAGDIFQVVLSQRFETEFTLPPFALYRALRRVNPSPFLYYLDFDRFSIIGSSPEILVRVRDGKVSLRPIAGTRRRGATPAEDRALGEELLADPKERAEHLMLLDLGRNDVGRVAEIGSVKVTDQFILEYYSQVIHIVSNVEGKLDPRHDAIDALSAGFPGRNGVGRAEGAGDGDHRRTGARKARALCRLRRLFLGDRRDGHLHRAAHRHRQGRQDVCAGRRRHRRRQRSGERARRVRQQGQGAVPGGGRSHPLRRPRRTGAVM
jgi:anthranilate/para-aminobenzoate synthase component I